MSGWAAAILWRAGHQGGGGARCNGRTTDEEARPTVERLIAEECNKRKVSLTEIPEREPLRCYIPLSRETCRAN